MVNIQTFRARVRNRLHLLYCKLQEVKSVPALQKPALVEAAKKLLVSIAVCLILGNESRPTITAIATIILALLVEIVADIILWLIRSQS